MKEKIIQLEKLLSDLNEEISKQTYIETISITDLNQTMREWQNHDFLKAHTDDFKKYISNHKSEENLKVFYEDYIPAIRSVLTTTLKNIKLIEKKKAENSNSWVNVSLPNRDFKNLLEKNLVTSEQEIFGTFKRQTFTGRLTNDGFFELDIGGEKILCPDFKYAILRAWRKVVPNDGWYVWSTIDNKTGKTKSLNYFRNQLKKLL